MVLPPLRPAVGVGVDGAAGLRAPEGRAHLNMNGDWRPAYVAIGSNLNNPGDQVLEAFARLGAVPSTLRITLSRLYLTRPMGPQQQPYFVNAAAGLLTQLAARELLNHLQAIEGLMGRTQLERWGPRVIDLDLLWMLDSATDEPELCLPHPGVSTRNFVLYPLADIAPTLNIPGHGRVLDLLRSADEDGISVYSA